MKLERNWRSGKGKDTYGSSLWKAMRKGDFGFSPRTRFYAGNGMRSWA